MPDTPNVMLILLDAMRKDALGVYGGNHATPNLDSFSRDSLVYSNCVSAAPWTIPSHVSMFTGQYPSRHGVHETEDKKANDILGQMNSLDSEVIASHLQKRGLSTVGMSANWMLSLHRGFDRGFDFFTSVDEGNAVTEEEVSAIKRVATYGKGKKEILWHLASHGKIRELLGLYRISRDIARRKNESRYPMIKGGDKIVKMVRNSFFQEPFFFFVNLLEMHDPYTDYEQDTANKGAFASVQMADLFQFRQIPESVMSSIRQGYYLSASRVDGFFGQLVQYFKNNNMYDNSLIIVTSDHGQALRERNFYGHGTFLYDEIVEVPLIVKFPRSRKCEIAKGYQSLVDIPKLIKHGVDGGSAEDIMSRPSVFSESFGTQNRPPNLPNKPDMQERVERLRRMYDRPRKVMYKDGYKIEVDWIDRSVRRLSFGGKSLDTGLEHEVVNSMISDLEDFSRGERTSNLEGTQMSEQDEEVVSERLKSLGYL